MSSRSVTAVSDYGTPTAIFYVVGTSAVVGAPYTTVLAFSRTSTYDVYSYGVFSTPLP